MSENLVDLEYKVKANAQCRGSVELFYPPPEERPPARLRREAAAKKICSMCPVQVDCLNLALKNREEHGIWGGMDEIERRQYRRV